MAKKKKISQHQAIYLEKVIHMVRDGRAISHSLVSRGLEVQSTNNHMSNIRIQQKSLASSDSYWQFALLGLKELFKF